MRRYSDALDPRKNRHGQADLALVIPLKYPPLTLTHRRPLDQSTRLGSILGPRPARPKLASTTVSFLGATSPITLTTPRRSQRETAVSDDNVEIYQLPSHRLELPVVLAQDSIASIESVDLEAIPESVV